MARAHRLRPAIEAFEGTLEFSIVFSVKQRPDKVCDHRAGPDHHATTGVIAQRLSLHTHVEPSPRPCGCHSGLRIPAASAVQLSVKAPSLYDQRTSYVRRVLI